MANTFVTPSDVIYDANLVLADQLILGNLVNRSIEERFAKKVGDTVSVRVPPTLAGSELANGGNTSATDITQTAVEVVMQKHFYVRVDLTSEELTWKLDDFNEQVMIPAVNGLIDKIETYGMEHVSGGFARYLTGTAGNNPSTHAHILAAEQQIFDNKGNRGQLIGLITGTAHSSFSQLSVFTSKDFGDDRPDGLANNSLGRLSNVDFFRTPYAGDFTRGDIAGTVLVDGASQTGSTLHVDDFTAADGTVYEGTRFTVAGISQVFTVTADTTIATNEATLPIYPVLPSSPADDAAVTFATAHKENIVYNPSGVAGAILPGAIMGPNVAAGHAKGVGLRITADVSTTTLNGTWVFDLYCGFRVVRPQFGAVMQG